MKIYSILSVILVTLCFFACKSNKENEYQPLTIENYAEVSLGDTTNLIITGGSGNIIVEGNDKVDIATAQNDKHKITLIGKEIGTTNIFVRDKITNESCSIEVNLKSATLLKSQSVAAQTAKNAIFLVRTDFLPCVG